jgi:catechol 2,3-dioxygenase-like lactoylglutathione lyase family enzyme
MTRIRHIAVCVADLRAAEEFYQPLFEMELIGREAKLGDGSWYTLPLEKSWEDAEAAGVRLGMLALRRGEFVLALIQGDAPQGQVFAIGLSLSAEEIAGVRARLPAEAAVLHAEPDALVFRDRYQIEWQITVPGNAFRTAGDLADRWIGR